MSQLLKLSFPVPDPIEPICPVVTLEIARWVEQDSQANPATDLMSCSVHQQAFSAALIVQIHAASLIWVQGKPHMCLLKQTVARSWIKHHSNKKQLLHMPAAWGWISEARQPMSFCLHEVMLLIGNLTG